MIIHYHPHFLHQLHIEKEYQLWKVKVLMVVLTTNMQTHFKLQSNIIFE